MEQLSRTGIRTAWCTTATTCSARPDRTRGFSISGVAPFTGSTLFLEGHRQNSANFGDVRQSSLLLRFGQLTPAFVLQVLAPLLLVFVGHAAVARERESGTLRVLLAQGVRPAQLVAGKALALGGVAGLVLLPGLVALAAVGLSTPGQGGAAAALALAHAAWLAIWVVGIAAASAWLPRGRDVLLVLLAAWAAWVVVVPRLALSWPWPARHCPRASRPTSRSPATSPPSGTATTPTTRTSRRSASRCWPGTAWRASRTCP